MIKKLLAMVLAVSLSFVPAAMNINISASSVLAEMLTPAVWTDVQARNLQKLCRVWGFAKYTHKSFLLGTKDWDEELLSLLPGVQSADEEAVNDILYAWFAGLGDDGYDLDMTAYRSSLLTEYEDFPECCDLIMDFFDDKDDFAPASLRKLNEELWLLSAGYELNPRQMADVSWINDDYLGRSLASVLSRFQEIQVEAGENAPVSLDQYGRVAFTNEKSYTDMDYRDSGYRILGLFRLWNAIEYYFPYKDIMDDDWNGLLLEYIPKMLEGSDRPSYESTIAALTSKLHDAHVVFLNGLTRVLFNSAYGSFIAPVKLTEAEGKLVVSGVPESYRQSRRMLLPGDTVLRLNGTDIDEIAAGMLQYLSYPNDEKALAYLASRDFILRQKTREQMEIDVLRDGVEIRIGVRTVKQDIKYLAGSEISCSHMILEHNIGLINPSKTVTGEFHNVMRDLAGTDGLIVDLRQYPGSHITHELAVYLIDEKLPFVIMSKPLLSVPGVFADMLRGYSGAGTLTDRQAINRSRNIIQAHDAPPEAYLYDKNVVILMNEETISAAEFAIMSLRNGSNVTVMGSNSIGADGDVVELPLPGGFIMRYTGFGVYTMEGGQTQRIGLSPDISVLRTIEGIRDGRDELMEAAIQFILEQKQ